MCVLMKHISTLQSPLVNSSLKCEFGVSLHISRDAPQLTHLGVTQITVVSRHKPLICQAAHYEGHMHLVFIQEQNFAHLPEKANHVMFKSQSNSHLVVMQKRAQLSTLSRQKRSTNNLSFNRITSNDWAGTMTDDILSAWHGRL